MVTQTVNFPTKHMRKNSGLTVLGTFVSQSISPRLHEHSLAATRQDQESEIIELPQTRTPRAQAADATVVEPTGNTPGKLVNALIHMTTLSSLSVQRARTGSHVLMRPTLLKKANASGLLPNIVCTTPELEVRGHISLSLEHMMSQLVIYPLSVMESNLELEVKNKQVRPRLRQVRLPMLAPSAVEVGPLKLPRGRQQIGILPKLVAQISMSDSGLHTVTTQQFLKMLTIGQTSTSAKLSNSFASAPKPRFVFHLESCTRDGGMHPNT